MTLEDVQRMARRARSLMLARNDRFVCCVDMRRLTVLSPAVSEAMLGNLKARGDRIDRTGVLLPESSPTLAMQIERLHREAGNPARRTFRRSDELVAFVGEALDAAECVRLATFLQEELTSPLPASTSPSRPSP